MAQTAAFPDNLKYASATQIYQYAGCQPNGAQRNTPSNYVNKGVDYSYENLTVCRMAGIANPANPYGTNTTFCANGFKNLGGFDVDKPAICGGNGPNWIEEYTPAGAAFAAQQGAIEDLYSYYLQQDKSRVIVATGIVLFVLIIAIALITA